MKMLLINPPMQIDSKPEIPPLGIAYVAQELKRNGYAVEILDIDSNRFLKEEVSLFIRKSSPDIIGIGGLVTVYPYLTWLVPEIRRLRIRTEIILGGAVASSLKERCFRTLDIDYVVIGEGEVTIVELLKTLGAAGDLYSVRGIGFRDKSDRDKIIFTQDRPLMPSLDSVPIFDDTPFPMERLLKNTKGTLQIHVQRGCPSRCTFCFNCYRVVSGKVRYRPVRNVIDEIEFFKAKFGSKVNLFALSGECITMNKNWLIDFCRELMKRKLNIRYRVTSRVDTIDEERLEWLKRSGCATMSLGLESGSEKILRIMKKDATAEQGRKAALLAKKYIPEIEACIILGYLGEDAQTLAQTVDFCKEIGIRPALFFATPFPGTELYRSAVEKGRIKDEEAYLMGLDRTLTFNLSLNLTDMPDEEAFSALKSAANEIERYYLSREIKSLKVSRRIWAKVKEDGPVRTLGWILKRSKEVFAADR
jgi:anaerobic magnesium-protoporphyrin IX monomethyl ester cyclase